MSVMMSRGICVIMLRASSAIVSMCSYVGGLVKASMWSSSMRSSQVVLCGASWCLCPLFPRTVPDRWWSVGMLLLSVPGVDDYRASRVVPYGFSFESLFVGQLLFDAHLPEGYKASPDIFRLLGEALKVSSSGLRVKDCRSRCRAFLEAPFVEDNELVQKVLPC